MEKKQSTCNIHNITETLINKIIKRKIRYQFYIKILEIQVKYDILNNGW